MIYKLFAIALGVLIPAAALAENGPSGGCGYGGGCRYQGTVEQWQDAHKPAPVKPPAQKRKDRVR